MLDNYIFLCYIIFMKGVAMLKDFLPHNLVDWTGVIVAGVSFIKYGMTSFNKALLNNVRLPLDKLTQKLNQLEHTTEIRLDRHDREISELKGMLND